MPGIKGYRQLASLKQQARVCAAIGAHPVLQGWGVSFWALPVPRIRRPTAFMFCDPQVFSKCQPTLGALANNRVWTRWARTSSTFRPVEPKQSPVCPSLSDIQQGLKRVSLRERGAGRSGPASWRGSGAGTHTPQGALQAEANQQGHTPSCSLTAQRLQGVRGFREQLLSRTKSDHVSDAENQLLFPRFIICSCKRPR